VGAIYFLYFTHFDVYGFKTLT